MTKVIVHCAVKLESAPENTRLIRSMCHEFNDEQYGGLRYAVFKGTDGVTFYHLALMLGEHYPLPNSGGCKVDIDERYDDVARHLRVSELGSYACLSVAVNPPSGGQ